MIYLSTIQIMSIPTPCSVSRPCSSCCVNSSYGMTCSTICFFDRHAALTSGRIAVRADAPAIAMNTERIHVLGSTEYSCVSDTGLDQDRGRSSCHLARTSGPAQLRAGLTGVWHMDHFSRWEKRSIFQTIFPPKMVHFPA